MSKQASHALNDPIKDIMLMVGLKPPFAKHYTMYERDSSEHLEWEDNFEILDIYINGKPFKGLATNKINVRFYFSNKPFKRDSWMDRLLGVMPSYWGEFFIGYEGHFCLSVHLNIDRYELLSKCDNFIISSSEMRNEKGKYIKTKPNYAQYAKEHISSIATSISFNQYMDLPSGGGGKTKPRPKPSLESYFESISQQEAIFN